MRLVRLVFVPEVHSPLDDGVSVNPPGSIWETVVLGYQLNDLAQLAAKDLEIKNYGRDYG